MDSTSASSFRFTKTGYHSLRECWRADIVRRMHKLIFALLLVQAPAATPPVVRKTVTTTNGQMLTGRVLNEGMSDLQLLTDDQRVHLLRKTNTERFREVTSQKDWPTYHGDFSGNRYTTI